MLDRAPSRTRAPLSLLLVMALGAGCGTSPLPDEPSVFSASPDGGVTRSAVRVPPVSGGTLLILRDGTAVAADSDRDTVSIVDVNAAAVRATVALPPGSEPGRVIEDGAGRVHVVLRSAGAIATIDPAAGRLTDVRAVCPVPRGLAWRRSTDELLIACMGGELVRLGPAAPAAAAVTLPLDRDLRDVVVGEGAAESIYLTRFRAAEVLRLNADLSLRQRVKLPGQTSGSGATILTFEPEVAWRAMPLPDGTGVAVVHQRAESTLIGAVVTPGYYNAVSRTVVSVVSDALHDTAVQPLGNAVLPVDLAIAPDGTRMAVASPGNGPPLAPFGNNVIDLRWNGHLPANGTPGGFVAEDGQPVAVAFLPDGSLVVQSREPAWLRVVRTPPVTIPLSHESRADSGHRIFHASANLRTNIACASCHPEGGDDGHVWKFAEGTRRTPPLRGGIARRAPLHWDGGERDLRAIADDVYARRMSGPTLTDGELEALAGWLETVPQLPPGRMIDPAAVARGAALSQQLHCASCHDTESVKFADVHTGGHFKAPPLAAVAHRAPYLHTGCAATLADRFGPCGGGPAHDGADQLTADQIADLVAWLESR